ncbi:ABC transporter substrate-binding protein [Coraliomargarita parva]|uniref:ABC transporter substrate-binding protein n=1 Tax=Coraliomargarita parva TaxID=3014050 RepID=UPI0022B39814|nr:ABC transporter substrate-binding protein [Coraliomargarita parva]
MTNELLEEEPVFPENEGAPARQLDYLGYAPCPIRKELQRRMHAYFNAHKSEFGPIEWFSPDGCFHGSGDNDPYDLVWKGEDPSDMPGVMTDGGSSDFFTAEGHERWIASGVYADDAGIHTQIRPEFAEAGLEDPLGAMHLYASFPSVIMVDLEKLGDRPSPLGWKDLGNPIYKGDITLAGHDDNELSDNMLFNTWKNFGDDGLRALASNMKQFWAPAKMMKAIGAGHPDGTAIYCLNYFFAKACHRSEKARLVWPEEGAWFQPLMVLARKGRRPASQLAIDFLFTPEWGRYLDQVGFPPVYSYEGQPALPGKMSWAGWDFFRQPDLEAKREAMQAVFQEALHL